MAIVRHPAVSSAALLLFAAGCAGGGEDTGLADAADLPHWTFDSANVFPADLSLLRAEDGVALLDGRLLVVDQAHGLRLIEQDGSSEPFGQMVAAGYAHLPPEQAGGANGISLEPDGEHLLVTDIFKGRIYRVALATGATEMIYQHTYGINSAVRDSRGAIWFTQSAHNTPEQGEGRMWAAIENPVTEGALYRLGREGGAAVRLVDSLLFANGLAIDEAAGLVYLAETMAGRVLRFPVDLTTGQLGERSVALEIATPDNLELDNAGRLWIASPVNSQLVMLNTATGEVHTAFQSQTPAQAATAAEIARRGQAGEPILELFTPDLWAPLPGFLTGVILGLDGQPAYLTGLGNALVRLAP